MNDLTDTITNNIYKTLKNLYDLQVTLPDGTVYVPISQAELARIMNVSTITMNGIFKTLKANELVLPYEHKRGAYVLTDKANIVINKMNQLTEIIKEEK